MVMSGTVALRIAARLESIDCSPQVMSVKGMAMLIAPMTARRR